MDDVFIDALVANQSSFDRGPNSSPNVGAVCAARRAVNSRFEMPFALAYRWRPEPKWDELKIIFGEPANESDTSSRANESNTSSSVDDFIRNDSSSRATILEVSDYKAKVSSTSSVPKSA
ncbi:hypothetical protein Salat_0671800 [Sesamum alatum]|uniref:Uncharacterized protein n=1 Tax=Sesamum alatum TaxID=300844 RepID=A0AAE1YRJ5_9LAMI|nr:hypothetical protein Salat_0671800 [Sesamum alatum]